MAASIYLTACTGPSSSSAYPEMRSAGRASTEVPVSGESFVGSYAGLRGSYPIRSLARRNRFSNNFLTFS